MPGFDNGIVYGAGERLTPSSAADILRMQQAATDVASINYTGNPEGAVAANPSSLSHDPVSGSVYRKATGTGNTGWALMDSEVPIGGMQYFPTANNTTYPNPNWLLCDGSVVNQADYPTLYQRVGLINEVGTNFTPVVDATITVTQYSVVYGNSTYVSVGSGGSAYTSTDGLTWTARTSGTASAIRTMTFGNGIFVYGTANGGISTSTDGVTWTARTSGSTSSINSINYVNNLYIYTAFGGGLSTSTDAITWTARTTGTSSNINALLYANSLYVYGGAGGVLATSTDAITWTARTSNITSSISALWYENSTYFYGSSSVIFTSTDAITWKRPRQQVFSSVFFGGTLPLPQVIKINGTYFAVGQSSAFATSTDGLNFKTQVLEATNGALQTINFVAYNGNNTVVGCTSSPSGGGSMIGSVYSYNTATQFKLPTQYFYNTNTTDNLFSNLYIKAL